MQNTDPGPGQSGHVAGQAYDGVTRGAGIDCDENALKHFLCPFVSVHQDCTGMRPRRGRGLLMNNRVVLVCSCGHW
ncbi:hypothetical protein SHO565_69150 [Streptomyces sp. HO565]